MANYTDSYLISRGPSPSRATLGSHGYAEVLVVLLDERRPLGWHLGVGENRLHRALGLARPAVDALVWVDVVLILSFVDAVHRADVDARGVLGSDAGELGSKGV